MKGALYAMISLLLVVVLIVAIFGSRGHHFTRPPFEVFPDMNYQDKVKDQVPSSFFLGWGGCARPDSGDGGGGDAGEDRLLGEREVGRDALGRRDSGA